MEHFAASKSDNVDRCIVINTKSCSLPTLISNWKPVTWKTLRWVGSLFVKNIYYIPMWIYIYICGQRNKACKRYTPTVIILERLKKGFIKDCFCFSYFFTFLQ